MAELKNRYDFVLLFDVKDGNPNGDPDAGNLPRIDPETNHGLVTDVCLKRKVRNFVQLSRQGAKGFDIFVKEKAILNKTIEDTCKAAGLEFEKKKGKGDDEDDAKAKLKDSDAGAHAMCKAFYDVRCFGAVMSTGPNAGQVRGPVQLTFARSVDPIVPIEHSITRMAVATEKEAEKQSGDNRTMGRKNTVPYGLYQAYGFVNPMLARKTGFGTDDLDLLWQALGQMFEQDRSAARGLMSLRRLIAFKHADELGSFPAHRLFELVKVSRRAAASLAPRSFEDYEVSLGKAPERIEVLEPVRT